MPVYGCAGTCDRLISVSSIPGGNPVALNDPDNYAVNYKTCTGCKQYVCDRCEKDGKCPSCGGDLQAAS